MPFKRDKLRAAIVGAGTVAFGLSKKNYPLTHYKSYDALSDHVELIGFVESSETQCRLVEEFFPHLRSYESVNDLFDNERIDILSICTPDCTHEELLFKALDASIRGIWCEKPLALSIVAAEKITHMSIKTRIPIEVNYFRRFIPEIRILYKEIMAGIYGDIKLMNGFYANTYIHNGSHLLDLMRYFAEELTLVHAFKCGHLNEYNDGPVTIICKGARDIYCTLQPISRDYYNIFELDIFCEKARIRIAENGRRVEIFYPEDDKAFPHLKILSVGSETRLCRWQESFNGALANLIDMVEGKEICAISPAKHSITIAKIIQHVSEMVS